MLLWPPTSMARSHLFWFRDSGFWPHPHARTGIVLIGITLDFYLSKYTSYCDKGAMFCWRPPFVDVIIHISLSLSLETKRLGEVIAVLGLGAPCMENVEEYSSCSSPFPVTLLCLMWGMFYMGILLHTLWGHYSKQYSCRQATQSSPLWIHPREQESCMKAPTPVSRDLI